MSRKNRIVDIDKGWDRVMRNLRNSRAQVAVGIPQSQDAPKKGSSGKSPPSLVQVAAVHEFGSRHIPRRSFIGDTVDPRRARYVKIAAVNAVDILLGRTSTNRVLSRVGLAMVRDIKARISSGIGPALSAITIKRKGSSKPLIATGQLRGSITHEVRGA